MNSGCPELAEGQIDDYGGHGELQIDESQMDD
jgi:hypothetical protein